jgi:hypothetical protein
VVVTSYEYRHAESGNWIGLYEAIIAEDRSHGHMVFLKQQSQFDLEHALRTLLQSTNELVKKVIMDTPAESLEVEPLNQDDTNADAHGDESGQHTKESNQSLGEKEMERYYHALGHVLDLASKNRVIERETEIES